MKPFWLARFVKELARQLKAPQVPFDYDELQWHLKQTRSFSSNADLSRVKQNMLYANTDAHTRTRARMQAHRLMPVRISIPIRTCTGFDICLNNTGVCV